MFSKLRRVLMIVLGLLLLALFIWFAGPYVPFGDSQPFESASARLILIAAIIALCGAVVLWKRLRARRASDQLVAAVVRQAEAEPAPSAELVLLRERFEEAVTTLKQQRRGGHSLYDLPWYVIIGAPGSGKSTALKHSGLNFPLEQRSGRGALRGVGGTRNCDWWFTDEAVFLDTAGRYLTQDSDATADKAAWTEFLALLRKYRKRRPVNGVLLTISAQDLMLQGENDLEEHVNAARRRLVELNRELRINVPVYVLVTKCDLVIGFTEYFDDLTREGRAQVWGVTFPYEQTQKGAAAERFPAEFDALIERLNSRLFARVEEDRDLRRRAKIFGFPQQVASLRETLTSFVRDVFGSTRFDQKTLLRGVYFTSGTQEGTPIDRLLGALTRRFAVAPDAVPASGRGKAYFIERLLKEVMFSESGIAGINRRFEVQMAAAQVAAYAAVVIVAVLALVLWTISYRANRNYLETVAADAAKLAEVPAVGASASLDTTLPRLDAVRAVVDSANHHGGGAPWSMRWGLYQGGSLAETAEEAYARELRGALLPHVAARFRQRLLQNSAEPEMLYQYLKAYLMLGDPDRLDKERLAFLANIEWENAYGLDPDRRTRVANHFQQLLAFEGRLQPVPLDEPLIVQARNTLLQASKPGLIYRYIRIEYANDTEGALRLDQLAGLNAEKVLRRKSGVSLSQPVPSLYTKKVFEEITGKGIDLLVARFLAEYWVWGDKGPTVSDTASLSKQVLDVYETDYIAAWDQIVNDISSAPLSSLAQTKESLAILSGPTSPLRGLLKVVDDNTYFMKAQDAAKPGLAGFGNKIDELLKKTKTVVGIATAQPGARITAHFEPVHRLVTGAAGQAPIDGILEKLRQLQQQLQPLGDEVGAKSPADPQTIASVGGIATELKRDVAPLPPSVATVVTQVANGTSAVIRRVVGGTVENRYREEVVSECTLVVGNRYPFFRDSSVDVPLLDFGRLFGHGGVYDAFFKKELASLVDTSRSPWTWRTDQSGGAVGGSLAMLRQFEAAQDIRDMFFRSGSQDPELRFTMTPFALDTGAQRVSFEVDGQVATYLHAAPRDVLMTWPGPKPGNAAVTFEERSGRGANIVREGTWAWFKLVDAGRVQQESDVRYVMTFEQNGHEARATLVAPSLRNPYAKNHLQTFRCG